MIKRRMTEQTNKERKELSPLVCHLVLVESCFVFIDYSLVVNPRRRFSTLGKAQISLTLVRLSIDHRNEGHGRESEKETIKSRWTANRDSNDASSRILAVEKKG